ncbi:hypothetical protein RSOL_548200, partial [Rhizoctonia solani AG-3 Rhs1AP]
MSYADAACLNAGNISQQPRPNPNLLTTEEDVGGSLPDIINYQLFNTRPNYFGEAGSGGNYQLLSAYEASSSYKSESPSADSEAFNQERTPQGGSPQKMLDLDLCLLGFPYYA